MTVCPAAFRRRICQVEGPQLAPCRLPRRYNRRQSAQSGRRRMTGLRQARFRCRVVAESALNSGLGGLIESSMRYVTNVMLHCSVIDRHLIDEVNHFFDGDPGRGLIDVHAPGHWYGGTKGFEASLFVAACNHLNLQALYEHVRKIVWREPGSVQLIVKDQEDFAFRAIQVFPDAFTVKQNRQVQEFAGTWPQPPLGALRLGGLPSLGVISAQPIPLPDDPPAPERR